MPRVAARLLRCMLQAQQAQWHALIDHNAFVAPQGALRSIASTPCGHWGLGAGMARHAPHHQPVQPFHTATPQHGPSTYGRHEGQPARPAGGARLGRVPPVMPLTRRDGGDTSDTDATASAPGRAAIASLLLRVPGGRKYPLAKLAVCDAATYAAYLADARLGMPPVFGMGGPPARRRAMRYTLLRRERLLRALSPEEGEALEGVDAAALAARSAVAGATADEAAAAVVSLIVFRRVVELLAAARASLEAELATASVGAAATASGQGSPSTGVDIDELQLLSVLADWDLDSYAAYVDVLLQTEGSSDGVGPSIWDIEELQLEAEGGEAAREGAQGQQRRRWRRHEVRDMLRATRALLAALSPAERARPLFLSAGCMADVGRQAGLPAQTVAQLLQHFYVLKQRPFELALNMLGEAAAAATGPEEGAGAVAEAWEGPAAAVEQQQAGQPSQPQAQGEVGSTGAAAAAQQPAALPLLDDFAAALDKSRLPSTAAPPGAPAGMNVSAASARAARLLQLRHKRMIDHLTSKEKRTIEATAAAAVRSPTDGSMAAQAPEPGLGLSAAQQEAVAARCGCSVAELQELLATYASMCRVQAQLAAQQQQDD